MPRKYMQVITSNAAKKEFFKHENVEMNKHPEEQESGVINIFDDVKYQEILGFGGAFTEASAYNYSLMGEKTKKEFLKAYFDRKEGIAYNFGRTHINSCDFALDIYTNVEDEDKELKTFNIERDKKYIIPFLVDAMKYCEDKLVLFASPWSPPAFMKDNASMIEGGKLLDEYKNSWALYYAKYIKAYKNEGINISAITVQNEPKALQTWESCFFSPDDEKEFIEKHLIPVLDEEGLSDIKIIIWDHNKERVYDRTKKILRSKAVKERVWAVGHHWYSGDHFDGLRITHEKFKKPLICTEFCGIITSDEIALAERYGKEMCENANNYVIASCDWNMVLNENGGPFHNRSKESVAEPGVVHDDTNGGCYAPVLYHKDTDELELTAIYYYIGHYSKFVKRGAKRIAVTKYTDKFYTTAFVNPDGTKVCVIMNNSDADMPAFIRWHDKCTKISMAAHSISTLVF